LPGDTITFDTTGVFATPQTIVLTTGELLVDKNLTILGPGFANLAVDGNAASRVFHIGPGRTVTISGLTVADGSNSATNTADSGGGIFNDHANLTIRGCVLANNTAAYGGGVLNYTASSSSNAMLTITNSTSAAIPPPWREARFSTKASIWATQQ